MSLPLMVRPNSIIVMGNNETRPDYDYASGVIFHVFEQADGSTCAATVISTEGHEEAAMSVRRDGRTLTIKRQGTVKPWSVCLRNVFGVSGVEGGSSERGNGGIVILPDKGVEMVTVKLGEIR